MDSPDDDFSLWKERLIVLMVVFLIPVFYYGIFMVFMWWFSANFRLD